MAMSTAACFFRDGGGRATCAAAGAGSGLDSISEAEGVAVSKIG